VDWWVNNPGLTSPCTGGDIDELLLEVPVDNVKT
jgi:hypothetical protein